MSRKFRYPEFENPQVRPRYTGIPTFFRAPFQETATGLDIALVGIPFDGGVTNRTGEKINQIAILTTTEDGKLDVYRDDPSNHVGRLEEMIEESKTGKIGGQ